MYKIHFRFKDGTVIPHISMPTISFARIIRTQFGRYHCSAISDINNGTSDDLFVDVYCKCYLLFVDVNEIIGDCFLKKYRFP